MPRGPEIEAAATFMYRPTLPSQASFADRALVQKMTAVDRADGNETQIPDGPPDGAIAEAARAYPWAPLVQIIGADPFAAEQALVESSAAVDVPVAHRAPFLRFQTQHVSNLPGSVVALQRGPWQTGNLGQ